MSKKLFKHTNIDNKYNDDLCKILHKSVPKIEAITGNDEIKFGNFMIKPASSLVGTSVWFKKQFIIYIVDHPGHKFVAIHSPISRPHLTNTMLDVILSCFIKSFKHNEPHHKSFSKQESIDIVREMMVETHEYFTTDEIVENSDLLFGTNKTQSEFRD